MEKHIIHNGRYGLDEVDDILNQATLLELGEDVSNRITHGAELVRKLAQGTGYIYGVNTGFGSLCESKIRPDQVELLQYNHVVSHAAGVGDPVPDRISRLTIFIKLLTLRSGNTGISLAPVHRLLFLWNANILPVIPEKGTVGASGDLAPLAHMSLPLIGLGEVWEKGVRRPSSILESEYGQHPLQLTAKEGLALTNGVQYIAAIAVDSLLRLKNLLDFADVIAALSLQAFSASKTFYDPLYHTTTFHEERKIVSRNLTWITKGGNHHSLPTAALSHQDPYSFRCIPQVHGAARQVYGFAAKTIADEINGVSDNPLFFAEQGVALCGGNLHGQSTAFVLDFLAIAAADMTSISERRGYQLQSGRRGLPDFLVSEAGVNSGLMLLQYTAAALVNESKVLCHPASVDTIPTCQLQEDHVSMGGTSGYKLRRILENLEIVLGIELMTAAQAADMTKGLKLSAQSQILLQEFRETVEYLAKDRIPSTDIERSHAFVVKNCRIWSDRLREGVANGV